MHPVPFHATPAAPSPPWFPMLPPNPPQSTPFWDTKNVHDRLKELQDTLTLATSMQKELEMLMTIKSTEGSVEDGEGESTNPYACGFYKYLKDRKIDLEAQESLSVNAANALMSRLRAQLEPFRVIIDDATPWEEKSMAARLSNKILKSKRNKLWRKRKRQRAAEIRTKVHEQFDQADRVVDEWRAREIARDAAQLKVEKMKEIAKLKAKEERKRLESELELVLVVEKLQELRSIRIQKMKKQGHFLPEEDDKFLERVRAAVEEEERQAMAAAETDAAKGAIATAEESRKTIQSGGPHSKDASDDKDGMKESNDEINKSTDNLGSGAAPGPSGEKGSKGQLYGGAYDSVANLPIEFYHYYHGSNNDMGTLIEVRRTWDAYIRPGGSRIPGHWVQPPPPADDIWASHLVRPK
ncbi:PREDICTED: U11/U12 small nuclear ribonucleoprotein 59 kDa protein isoform X2 [Populus euphratica]|uniref:U11/U12 small nuclear ribonucleoprotein 59 kDa protein isoform X2 n=1 Tax=Populus euphratica TaxID=75702 RepID=A0AAJ6UX45_POPEU|nr:PREDICTED: U11/U12 small nuclear ribonucleoprotein 59 kDa protein isoform X2 [Populus euphratica]